MAPDNRRTLRTTAFARWAGIALGVALVGLASWRGDCGSEPAQSGPSTRAPAFAEIPRIDVHVHVPPGHALRAARMFREHGGVYTALNASGGHPDGGLEESIAAAEPTHGALRQYCSIDFAKVESPAFDQYARSALVSCRKAGAVGLKIYKALGLGITLANGELLAIDDPRLDVAFESAGELGLPVLIHSGDPQAFFRPATSDNERYAELSAHPSWSFYGPRPDGHGAWPSWREVFDQYERRVARHPHTQFLGAHFGNAPEEPETVARMLDTYPNLFVETGARIPEIGRHPPARMRELLMRHRERILFGTDFQIHRDGTLVLGSAGDQPDPLERVPFFYRAHFRYFETNDRAFAHPSPIQGHWTIDGIGLTREVLEDLYYRNAVRLFHLPAPMNGGG